MKSAASVLKIGLKALRKSTPYCLHPAAEWVPVNSVLIWISESDRLTEKEEAHVRHLLDDGLRVVVTVRGDEEAARLGRRLKKSSLNLKVVDRSNRVARARLLLWMHELKQGPPGVGFAEPWGRHAMFAFLHPEPDGIEGSWLK